MRERVIAMLNPTAGASSKSKTRYDLTLIPTLKVQRSANWAGSSSDKL
jgi:hypothetical protein